MFDFLKRQRPEVLDWHVLQVEPTGSKESGPCACCGSMTRTVWGFVRAPAATLAAYFVHWTPDRPADNASFDLIVGKWGDNTSARDRQAVSLAYRVQDHQGSFMVRDAALREMADLDVASVALRREQVIGRPIAQEVFAIADAILLKDERLAEIRSW